ncbi:MULTISPECIES: lytic polysaccharide monooxygenase [Symbiopectobacterium]|uniref:lytic polysaccharide monooxygenase n=1 Tax=Symbiopectobacterium TaxID=801 RepID=UPI00207A7F02|nr:MULTISPECIES: lytic polysaccharide monooxygenase [Symbiopectobacterium]MBT9430546.1 lytic polysaccharide monooxygenase [Candidatus Symbiopectobacterium endolongispinus]
MPDGRIFSGGQTANNRDIVNLTDAELEMRHGVRWLRTNVESGQYLKISWNHTVVHATRGYRYFITRNGLDPTRRATRADFEDAPFASVINRTPPLNTMPMQAIKLPTDRTGHHIILSVWMVSDTGAGFYSAFDVNFVGGGGGGGETENPASWSPNSVFYPVGVLCFAQRGVYRCRSAHTSNSGWAPGVAFTLWVYVRPMV